MSYARTGFGASASVDVSAIIQGQAPNIIGGLPLSTPKETLDQIVRSSPEIQQVKQDWGPAMDIVGKLNIPYGDIAKNPSLAVEFMMGALPTLLEAAGIDGAPADIAAIASGFAPQVGALTRGHTAPLVMAGIKTGAAYGCRELGIPPDIGNITIDAVLAGELTDKTLIAAGGLGGAVGGSALCSLIGVPPCIGGYIGGFAGKLAGGAIAGVLSIGGGKAEREQKRAERAKLEAAIRGQLDSIREQYVNFVSLKRGEWWANFDHIIDNVSFVWQALECNMAYTKFPLLWSGAGAVNPYFLHPYQTSLCAQPINRNLSRGTGCLDAKGLLSGVTASGCPEPYGCPYPAFHPIGGDAQTERVVQAFAAYDIWWMPPANRQAIDQMWVESLAKPNSVPHDAEVARHSGKSTWVNWIAHQQELRKTCQTNKCKAPLDAEVSAALSNYSADLSQTASDALSLEAIQGAVTRIVGDLGTTAGIYAAAAAINKQRSELIRGDLSKSLAKSKSDSDLIVSQNQALSRAMTSGRRMNSFVNYAMLALGGGLLGAAIMKDRRR